MRDRSRSFVSTPVRDWARKTPADLLFSPSALTPPVWLDASDTSTITASSGAVSQWNNKGSLGNFTQATAANQPVTGTTCQNGNNVLDFNGDFMAASTAADFKFLHDGTKYLVAVAWKPGIASDPNALYALLSTAATTLSVGTIIYFDDRASASTNNAMAHAMYRGVDNTFVVNGTSQDIITPNTWSLFTMLVDTSNATAAERTALFVNAGSANKPNTSTGAVSSSNPTNPLSVGSSGFPFTGSIGELVIVSGSAATESARTTLRNYLKVKWGVYS